MEQIKLELPIDFNTIQEGELRYFFRPFIWEQKKYGLFWEDNNHQSRNKTKSIITDIQISAHQLIENQPKDLSTSVSPIINLITSDTKAEKATIEHLINTEKDEVAEKATVEHLVNTEKDEVVEKATIEDLVNTEKDEVAEKATIEDLVNTEKDEVAEKATIESIVATENQTNNKKSQNSMSVLESYQNIAKRYK